MKPIVQELRNQGWRVELTTQGHAKAYPPDNTKQLVTFPPGGSGDPRAIKNTIAQLRRSGFVWPPQQSTAASLNDVLVGRLAPQEDVDNDTDDESEELPSKSDVQSSIPENPDQLFAELKQAREEYRLHAEIVQEIEDKLSKLLAELSQARETLDASRTKLVQTKENFDKSFDLLGTG